MKKDLEKFNLKAKFDFFSFLISFYPASLSHNTKSKFKIFAFHISMWYMCGNGKCIRNKRKCFKFFVCWALEVVHLYQNFPICAIVWNHLHADWFIVNKILLFSSRYNALHFMFALLLLLLWKIINFSSKYNLFKALLSPLTWIPRYRHIGIEISRQRSPVALSSLFWDIITRTRNSILNLRFDNTQVHIKSLSPDRESLFLCGATI